MLLEVSDINTVAVLLDCNARSIGIGNWKGNKDLKEEDIDENF